jgi:hypothetical protein
MGRPPKHIGVAVMLVMRAAGLVHEAKPGSLILTGSPRFGDATLTCLVGMKVALAL